MRSQLSRKVLRQCLGSNSAVRLRPWLVGPGRRPRLLGASPSCFHQLPWRRTFFGVFQKPPRRIKSASIDPGYETLLLFDDHVRKGLRPPRTDELVRAFNALFAFKARHGIPVNSNQAAASIGLLKYLVEQGKDAEGRELLSLENLRTAQRALSVTPGGKTTAHCKLSRALYEEISRRLSGLEAGAEPLQASSGAAAPASWEDFVAFIEVLARNGAALEASQVVEQHWQSLRRVVAAEERERLWMAVLQGLAKDGCGNELLSTAQVAEREGVEYGAAFHEVMTVFHARKGDLVELKRWFYKPIARGLKPTSRAFDEALRYSIRNRQHDWSSAYFKDLLESGPDKRCWDALFQWAVGCQGKGVEDVRRMMDMMAQQAPDLAVAEPDIETINGLVAVAIEKNDQYMAERFISMGIQLGLRPNARTFLLQLDYRVDANDLSGAQAAYEALQMEDPGQNDDLPAINKYLRALCRSGSAEKESTILNILEAVDDRQAILEPETVVALCTRFLQHDLQNDLIDTLMVHTLSYDYDERAVVRKALVRYCLDSTNSTARVWDCYSLLHQFFGDTDADDRVRLMDAFFFRRRPDMACFVFGHMRAHENETIRPTRDVYVRCFERLGQYPDAESLKVVHNMLKMDATIQPSTKLYNALMIAHAASGNPAAAMDFWKDIVDSAEGPDYNSLEIVFWTCERWAPAKRAEKEARQIWTKINAMQIDVPPAVYRSYVGALAAHGALDEAQALVKDMRSAVGEEPDVET